MNVYRKTNNSDIGIYYQKAEYVDEVKAKKSPLMPKGTKESIKDYLGKQNILYKNPHNLSLITYPYHLSLLNKEYYWFNNLSQEQFFESDMYISKLFRKLFKI